MRLGNLIAIAKLEGFLARSFCAASQVDPWDTGNDIGTRPAPVVSMNHPGSGEPDAITPYLSAA
jgi:hypothetical protein